MSRIFRHYVETGFGQLHLTECGTGRPVLLGHWAPLSAQMHLAELPIYAEAGYRAVAVDLFGYGRSDKPGAPLTIEQHGHALSEAVAAAGLEGAVLVGGHLAMGPMLALAHDESAKAAALVTDGGPLMPPEAVEALLKKARSLAGPGLQEDGSHRTFLWDQAANTLSIFAPGQAVDARTLGWIYRFIADYIETGMPAGFSGSDPFPVAEKLGALRLPVLALTAETEPLRASFEPIIEAARAGGNSHVEGHEFPGDHPLFDPARSGEFARRIIAFAETQALG